MSGKTDARTGLLGLLGHPVAHSLSPLFMNRTLERLSLNHRYLAFDVAPPDLEAAVEGLRALGARGANITIPHKQAVVSLLDRMDDEARSIGAVNCLVFREGLLEGGNTDHLGFIKPLIDRGIAIPGRRALVLGCGGAARAVVYALVREGIGELVLANRSESRAGELAGWCTRQLGLERVGYAGPGEEVTRETASSCDLVVNATPVGMHPRTGACPVSEQLAFGPGQVVYDLVYNPPRTRLLALARAGGARTINGLDMLVVQGLYALARWFPGQKEEIFSLQHAIITYTRRRFPGSRY
ncbi:MAG: shikimate dehydrogenase [Spirochaetota bacterium]